MYYDWTYILVLIGALISFVASLNVNGTFKRYNRVRNMNYNSSISKDRCCYYF